MILWVEVPEFPQFSWKAASLATPERHIVGENSHYFNKKSNRKWHFWWMRQSSFHFYFA